MNMNIMMDDVFNFMFSWTHKSSLQNNVMGTILFMANSILTR